ncbi:MAG: nucleotide exchange factor GrpE [Oscillospiraceae bacterium]|jgi:molecular chaperone GrpE|nr:nucleotide exchange factor GrpE [Oscillospiraceae bacterium]
MDDEAIITEETPVEPEVLDAPKPESSDAALAAEKDKYLRLAAEYANYKNRTKGELDSRFTDGKSEVVKAILPIWDNLDRALKQDSSDPAYKQGIELIMRQVNDTFERLGVAAIIAEPGTAFDPELHNAIAHVEDDALDANVVAEEFQRGFTLGGKVVRHSMVKAAN